jgi:hypothetical protein
MSVETQIAVLMERMEADAEAEFRQTMSQLAGLTIEPTEEFLSKFWMLAYGRGIARMQAVVDELGLVLPNGRPGGH